LHQWQAAAKPAGPAPTMIFVLNSQKFHGMFFKGQWVYLILDVDGIEILK